MNPDQDADVVLQEMVEDAPRQQPGEILRNAREEKGLSVAEITQALKFSARQIEALEKGDYSLLQGTTFLRGMVRSYARYLRLNDAELLALLQPELQPVLEVSEPVSLGDEMPREESAPSPLWRKLVPLLILLAILAGAWYAWQWRQTHHKEERSGEAQAEAVSAAKPPLQEALTPVLPPQPQIQSEVAPPAAVVPAPETAAPPPAAVASPVPAAAEAVAPPPAPPQLVFLLSERSWIEVRDATKKMIMRGEYPANSRQVVVGQAPYQVVIGNALHVRLQYNERNIDLQPYTYATVARLTVEDK